jgi:hypothetical protein
MGLQYSLKAIPSKDTVILAYRFFYQDDNHDVRQPMTTEKLMETNTYLSFELRSADIGRQLIHESKFLAVDLDGTSNIISSVSEAGYCFATVTQHIGDSVEILSSEIFIPPTVEHTISSYYIEC